MGRGNLMTTNSPMDDPTPTAPPQAEQPKRIPDNDWAKVGKSKKYPDIDKYIKSRIAFHQRFLPTGESITTLNKKERAEAWSNAVVIIEELEKLNETIQAQTTASKRNAAAGF